MPEFKTDFQNITKDAWSWVQRHGPKSTIDGTPVRGLMDVRQYVISVYHAHEAWDALLELAFGDGPREINFDCVNFI